MFIGASTPLIVGKSEIILHATKVFFSICVMEIEWSPLLISDVFGLFVFPCRNSPTLMTCS